VFGVQGGFAISPGFVGGFCQVFWLGFRSGAVCRSPSGGRGVEDTAYAPGVFGSDGADDGGAGATARSKAALGSSTVRIMRTVPPLRVSGLKFLCSGDSSATQKPRPLMARFETTAPVGSSWRKSSSAAKADL
jgi:hypothetical protein